MQDYSFLGNTKMIPSTSSLLSLYASFSTSMMLLKNAYRELVPHSIEEFVLSKLSILFFTRQKPESSNTFIIDDSWDGLDSNKLINAARFYLSSKIDSSNKIIRVGKFRGQESVTASLVEGETIDDVFDGIEITWKFAKPEKDSAGNDTHYYNKGYFEITFEDEHRDKIYNVYLAHILSTYKLMTKGEKVLNLYTRTSNGGWNCIDFQHPSTFDALAMDCKLKQSIMDDLNRFLSRRDYYKRIGKAWKRGYLLHGPPGTGKTSLIAAMANYLKFDVYDLDLANISSDGDLRRAMLDIDRKSITVIEDIDCNSEAHTRAKSKQKSSSDDSSDDERTVFKKFSLSGLLNSIDGLWSSCGEERIVVFTTNHKDVLDPALLRPGRMDMHIHMSYCTPQGFRILANNYLEVKEHPLFDEIDELIMSTEVTPASLAEELLTSEDADVALAVVVNFLKQRKMENEKTEEEKKIKKSKAEEEEKTKVDDEKKSSV